MEIQERLPSGKWVTVETVTREGASTGKQSHATKARATPVTASKETSKVLHVGQTSYEAGMRDGYKGRANRYASRRQLEESAWKVASKAERARQIRGGYTATDHGLLLDPYDNLKMIKLQLAAPGTPEAYKQGYWAGRAERDAER